MIRSDDFDIRFSSEAAGTVVRVTHIPTGNHRCRLVSHSETAGRVRDDLIAELRGKLFSPNDIRVDIGCSTGGDFIRVIHISSDIQRTALRRERSESDLLDEVLDELYADPDKLRLAREATPGSKSNGNN